MKHANTSSDPLVQLNTKSGLSVQDTRYWGYGENTHKIKHPPSRSKYTNSIYKSGMVRHEACFFT